MIEPVSFNGKLRIDKSMSKLIDKKDKKLLREIAKKEDCDIVILNKEEFKDNSNVYSSIIVKPNGETGSNDIFSYIFGFKKK